MHRDKIIIKGLHCSVRLGVKKEEQEVKRNCELDFWIYYDLSAAGRSDDLDLTVNYSKVIDIVQSLSQTVQYKLLESFAFRLFEEIFRNTTARRIRLRVKKMNPPIEARFQYVGVELVRNREEFIREEGK
ncbi:dihydroneopterin aldolase [bacterium]|nr:dihydroneopterin aldolase [bacterium]MCI0601712.1 dihydroneopterin aldolase [bacterium]